MDKKEIRAEVLKNLKNIPLREERCAAMAGRILSEFESQCVFVYVGVGDELETSAIIKGYLEKGTRVCIPKICGDEMVAVELTSVSQLRVGEFSIPTADGEEVSPETIDLCLIPGVAFDALGGRLGRGKGFYDKFLKNTEAEKVGLCFREQVVDRVPMNEFDVKMDRVLSC